MGCLWVEFLKRLAAGPAATCKSTTVDSYGSSTWENGCNGDGCTLVRAGCRSAIQANSRRRVTLACAIACTSAQGRREVADKACDDRRCSSLKHMPRNNTGDAGVSSDTARCADMGAVHGCHCLAQSGKPLLMPDASMWEAETHNNAGWTLVLSIVRAVQE